MTTIKNLQHETIEILDKLLVGNEINLIDTILSFLTVDCHRCKDKMIPDYYNTLETPDECYDSDCEKHCEDGVVLCEECSELYQCSNCGDSCYTCDKEPHRECDKEKCGNEFCDDCFYQCCITCCDCGESCCCEKFYMTDSGERQYFCEECIKVIQPPFN